MEEDDLFGDGPEFGNAADSGDAGGNAMVDADDSNKLKSQDSFTDMIENTFSADDNNDGSGDGVDINGPLDPSEDHIGSSSSGPDAPFETTGSSNSLPLGDLPDFDDPTEGNATTDPADSGVTDMDTKQTEEAGAVDGQNGDGLADAQNKEETDDVSNIDPLGDLGTPVPLDDSANRSGTPGNTQGDLDFMDPLDLDGDQPMASHSSQEGESGGNNVAAPGGENTSADTGVDGQTQESSETNPSDPEGSKSDPNAPPSSTDALPSSSEQPKVDEPKQTSDFSTFDPVAASDAQTGQPNERETQHPSTSAPSDESTTAATSGSAVAETSTNAPTTTAESTGSGPPAVADGNPNAEVGPTDMEVDSGSAPLTDASPPPPPPPPPPASASVAAGASTGGTGATQLNSATIVVKKEDEKVATPASGPTTPAVGTPTPLRKSPSSSSATGTSLKRSSSSSSSRGTSSRKKSKALNAAKKRAKLKQHDAIQWIVPFCDLRSMTALTMVSKEFKEVVSGTVEWKYRSMTLVKDLSGHIGAVNVLIQVHHYVFSGSSDGKIKIWNARNWNCEKTVHITPLPTEHPSHAVVSGEKPSPPGSTPAAAGTASSSASSKTASGRTKKPTAKAVTSGLASSSSTPQQDSDQFDSEQTKAVVSLAVLDKRMLFIGLEDGELAVRVITEYNSRSDNRKLKVHNGAVKAIAVFCQTSPNPNLSSYKLFTGGADRKIKVLEVSNYTEITAFEKHTGEITCLQIVGNRLFSGGQDGKLFVWDALNLKFEKSLDLLNGDKPLRMGCITALTQHENRLFSSSWDCYIRIWDTKKLTLINSVFIDPVGVAWSLAVRQVKGQPTFLVLGVREGDIEFRLIDKSNSLKVVGSLEKDEWCPVPNRHSEWVTCVLPLADGRIVSGCEDWSLKVWNQRFPPPLASQPSQTTQRANVTAAAPAANSRRGAGAGRGRGVPMQPQPGMPHPGQMQPGMHPSYAQGRGARPAYPAGMYPRPKGGPPGAVQGGPPQPYPNQYANYAPTGGPQQYPNARSPVYRGPPMHGGYGQQQPGPPPGQGQPMHAHVGPPPPGRGYPGGPPPPGAPGQPGQPPPRGYQYSAPHQGYQGQPPPRGYPPSRPPHPNYPPQRS